MLIRTLLAFAVCSGTSLFAETLTIELPANTPVEATLDTPLDDSHLRDPHGYRHHGAASHIFQRQLTLTNTGATPLTGSLVINNSDWSSPEALRESLHPKAPPSEWLPRLFT